MSILKLVTLALGCAQQIAVAAPESTSGCSCTSVCGKSLVKNLMAGAPNVEWCKVEASCNTQGWDWCHDATELANEAGAVHASLYNKAEMQRIEEHAKRADAEQEVESLKSQLTNMKKKLKVAEAQNAETAMSRRKIVQEAEFSRLKAEGEAKDLLKKVEYAKAEAKNLRGNLTEATLKLSESEGERLAATKKTADVEEKLHHAEEKSSDLGKRLKTSEEANEAAAQRLKRFKKAAVKGVRTLKAAAKKKLAEAKQTQDDMQKKADQEAAKMHNLEVKHAETVKELHDTQAAKHSAEESMKQAKAKQQSAELRTFRLAVRGAVRGGTGVVQKDGTVKHWKIR